MNVFLRDAAIGSAVGLVWESLGGAFFWRLAEPEDLLFILAIISWGILGSIFGCLLRKIKPTYRLAAKLAIGLCGLVVGKVTMELGLIFYGDIVPKIGGVPVIMVAGWLALAFILDYSNSKRRESA